MFITHAFCNLVGGSLVGEVSKDGIGIREGSCRAFACGDITINSDELASVISLFQQSFETRITSGFLAIEKT